MDTLTSPISRARTEPESETFHAADPSDPICKKMENHPTRSNKFIMMCPRWEVGSAQSPARKSCRRNGWTGLLSFVSLLIAAIALLACLETAASEPGKLEFTVQAIKIAGEVVYEEKSPSWHICDTAYNPVRTHLLVCREYVAKKGSRLMDFHVFLLRASPGGVLVAVRCRLRQAVNFERLGMTEAYWADDRRVAVISSAPIGAGSEKIAALRPTIMTHYFEVIDP
jgi:hypothetical protein